MYYKENNQLVYDGFIEDQYDARLITLQALIDEVGWEDALEIWKITDIRSEKRHHVHFVVVVNAVSFLCSCLMSISKGIICRHYFRVMMHSKTAAFHISMIPHRWYRDHYQDDSIPDNPIFNYEMGIFNDKNILPIRKPATIPTTIPTLKKSIYKRNLYGRVWGLAREATLLAVEQDDNEIVTYLQGYISRKRKGDNHTAHKRSTTDKISNNACEVQTDQSSDESEESEIEHEEDIEESLKSVKNPNKVNIKGRPPKRRYLSSVEKEQGHRGGSKSRGFYKCRICNQVGHNAAFHKNKEK